MFGLVCLALGAHAAPTLGVSLGDCADPELATRADAFHHALAQRLGSQLVMPASVLERLRPPPTASADELHGKLESAQARFYAGDLAASLELATTALQGIERLSPLADPWKLAVRAHLLRGLSLKGLTRKAEATEAFKRITRLDTKFTPDPDYYPPSTLGLFELGKKELTKAKRQPLTVTSTPAGAQVLLDGFVAGTTPLELELPAGDYTLQLRHKQQVSFVRAVRLEGAQKLTVDLSFEGAVVGQGPLCVASASHEPALRLAALVGASRLVVLRSDARRGEPGLLTAAGIDVGSGTVERSGAVRVRTPLEPKLLGDLADFVLTGKPADAVVDAPMVAAAPATAADVPAAALASPPAEVASSPIVGGTPVARWVSYGLAGAGAVVAGVGLGVYASGGADRAALGSLVDADGKLTQASSSSVAMGLAPRVDANGITTVALVGVGAGLLAAGVAVFFALPPEVPAQLAIGPTGVGVRGEF